jgi:hypothetical protein
MDKKIFFRNLEWFYRELYGSVVEPAQPLIRLGSKNDGGYLLPDDLSGIHSCFSPGVAQTADFEMEIAKSYGIPVFMCDHTVDASPLEHPLLHFQKTGIGYGQNASVHLQSMLEWVQRCMIPDNAELLIQMDIEGAEYDFFLFEKEQFFSRCRYIILEMHYLHQMLQPLYFENRLVPFLNQIKRYFDLIHIHPNNHTVFAEFAGLKITSCFEFTLARKNLNHKQQDQTESQLDKYPRHQLDAPNMPDKPDVELPDLKIIRSTLNSI